MVDPDQIGHREQRPAVVIGPCNVGSGSPYVWQQFDLPRWLRGAHAPATAAARTRLAFKVLAIAICVAVLGLCLPGFETLDYWVGMTAFLVALIVASTL